MFVFCWSEKWSDLWLKLWSEPWVFLSFFCDIRPSMVTHTRNLCSAFNLHARMHARVEFHFTSLHVNLLQESNINTFQKFEVGKVFVYVLEKSILFLPRLQLFDQKHSKNFEILLQFKITVCYFDIFKIVTYSVYKIQQSWIFSIIILQSSVSHDRSEIILICWFGAHYLMTRKFK